MKIVSWNCRQGYDKGKPEIIKKYDADILVVPECREIDMDKSGYDKAHRDWYGDHKEAKDISGNINKEKDLGIGIFWKDGITVTQLPEWKNSLCENNDFRYLVPYRVEGNFEPFILIAVWTKNIIKVDMNDKLSYVQKAHAAIDHYKNMGLLNDRVVLIGDFNSNIIWDDLYKDQSHSALVKKLKTEKIIDCSSTDAEKNHATYHYYTKNGEKQVVDDYCFASEIMVETLKFSIPSSEEWIPNENGVKSWNGSDHCPIIVEFHF